jgi:hypothetical protein
MGCLLQFFVVLNVVGCVVIVVFCVVNFCGWERATFFCCLGVPCAGGGHFVTCIPLRLALPLVAIKNLSADHREAQGEAGIRVTK